MNALFLDALLSKPTSRPPVWLMRQAGRYMASYRKLRAKYNFLDLCHTPELISQVTISAVEEFGFDAAIIFSDILLILEALGVPVTFIEGEGPVLTPLDSIRDIHKLKSFDVSQMSYLMKGIHDVKKQLKVPLIGFCGAPFTLACYLIEGRSSQKFTRTKRMMLQEEKGFSLLLDLLADAAACLLNAEIEAGADAVQIFDSWAYHLSWDHFQRYSLKYLKRILENLRPCPVILFCRGSSIFAEAIAEINPTCIGLDWQCSMAHIRKKIPNSISLQGNLDPEILLSSPEIVRKEVNALLFSMKKTAGFICNLGHGILPETPEDNVRVLVDCVKNSFSDGDAFLTL